MEVTKTDCEMRSFRFPVNWYWLPLRLGMGIRRPRRRILGPYFAGEVVGLGCAESRLKEGDAVFVCGQLRMGAYGEYMALPEGYTIVAKPNNASFAEAAATPLGGLNALHFLRRARLRKGESILINGAGGSIGLFGIQMSKTLGAAVTAVDKAVKETVIRQAGADCVVC